MEEIDIGVKTKASIHKLIDAGVLRGYDFRYLITGCPRSGTLFMALLFRSAGLPINHEVIYGVPSGGFILNYSIGESSALAVPFLNRTKEGTKIIHITRDPIKVVSGLHITWDPFGNEDNIFKYWFSQLAIRAIPEILDYEGLDRYLLFYIGWNKMAEEFTKMRYRLEDINKDPHQIFRDLGHDTSGMDLWTDPTTHTADVKKYYTPKDFDGCHFKKEFLEYCSYLGYEYDDGGQMKDN